MRGKLEEAMIASLSFRAWTIPSSNLTLNEIFTITCIERLSIMKRDSFLA